jgi:glycosyltransferase involved in cell wall biosynthesis
MAKLVRPGSDEVGPARVLRVVASLAAREGGPPTVVLGLEHKLGALDIRSSLLSTDAEGRHGRLPVSLGVETSWSGVPVVFNRVHFPKRFRMSVGHVRAVWRHSAEADAIHVHGLYMCSSVAAWLSARMRGIPLIAQPHGVLEPYHRQKSRAVKSTFDGVVGRRILRDSSAIVCASEQEAGSIQALGFVRTVVIEHGVTVEDGNPSAPIGALIEKLGSAPVVLFLGRLAKKKNPDLLVRAWSEAERGSAHLVISGPDDYWPAEHLRQLARSLGVSGSVTLAPAAYGPDKTALLRRANLFALPSDNESFGITIPEAMVAGTPCLVSGSVATSAVVRAADAGVVVDDLDPSSWARHITEVLREPERLATMGRNAARAATARFTWESAAAEYAALYRRVIRTGPATGR